MDSETVVVSLEELYAQFRERANLEARIAQMTEQLTKTEITTAEKPKKERKPTSKYASEEERKEAMRQNGLRLAAANKARREAEKAAKELEQPEQVEAEGEETPAVEEKPKKERKPRKPKAEPEESRVTVRAVFH